MSTQISINQIIENLSQHFKTNGISTYSESLLKNMSEDELRKLYADIFPSETKNKETEEELLMMGLFGKL